MPPKAGEAHDGWLSRYRQRHADRRTRRADRRARRSARALGGGDPSDAARQAESGNFQSGYFTTKTRPKP
jgi:hypothetical protein